MPEDFYGWCDLWQVGAAEGHWRSGGRVGGPGLSNPWLQETGSRSSHLRVSLGLLKGNTEREQLGTQRCAWGRWVVSVMRSSCQDFTRELAVQSQLCQLGSLGVPHTERPPPSSYTGFLLQWPLRASTPRETQAAHISKTVLLEEVVFLYVIIDTFSTTVKV